MIVQLQKPSGCVREDFRPVSGSALQENFSSYLSDESRMSGQADFIVFPTSEAETAQVLAETNSRHQSLTISGGRTGVVGGAVPNGGGILSVERMATTEKVWFDESAQEFRIRTQPGITLDKFRRHLQAGAFPFAHRPDQPTLELLDTLRKENCRWAFPPDPTEPSAQIGGMAASNASGARTFHFGPMRSHIRGLRVLLPNGLVLEIPRSGYVVAPGQLVQFVFEGTVLSQFTVPDYRIPTTKHAAGFYLGPSLDLMDLFIGSEGTLGVITAIDVALTRVRGLEAEIAAFLPSLSHVCRFVEIARQSRQATDFTVEAIEYLCDRSLAMITRSGNPRFRQLPGNGPHGVFLGIRIHGDIGGALKTIEQWLNDSGGHLNQSLVAMGAVNLAQIKEIRHALPETVNHRISEIRRQYPTITKLGTDMAVPDAHLQNIMQLYVSRLEESGLDFVIFGHIGNNHLHVNILPRTPAEFDLGKTLYRDFAHQVVAMGGSVSAEHGIGKVKRYLLDIQFPSGELEQMRATKKAFDPNLLLGPGTLFER